MDAGAQVAFSIFFFSFSLAPLSVGLCHPSSGWVFLSQLKLSGVTFADMCEGMCPRANDPGGSEFHQIAEEDSPSCMAGGSSSALGQGESLMWKDLRAHHSNPSLAVGTSSGPSVGSQGLYCSAPTLWGSVLTVRGRLCESNLSS